MMTWRPWLIGLALLAPAPAEAVGPLVTAPCGTFSWTEANPDGTPVAGLASFNIYVAGTAGSTGALVGSFVITPGYGTMFTWVCPATLPRGQRYATVTAVDTNGVESPRSVEFPFVLVLPAPQGLSVR
jgi:hypothetical protein